MEEVNEREMNKKIFSIIASLIMILTIFGAISASAQECVRLSGTVKAKFMNVWCDDELEILPLSGVIVTIEKIGDDGETVATTFTTTNEDGYYEQEVLKGTFFNPKTYRVSIKTTIMVIYGENYVFPGETKESIRSKTEQWYVS